MFIVNKRNSSIIQNFKNRRKKSKPIALFSTILRSPEVFLSLSLSSSWHVLFYDGRSNEDRHLWVENAKLAIVNHRPPCSLELRGPNQFKWFRKAHAFHRPTTTFGRPFAPWWSAAVRGRTNACTELRVGPPPLLLLLLLLLLLSWWTRPTTSGKHRAQRVWARWSIGLELYLYGGSRSIPLFHPRVLITLILEALAV